jgi:hypothetical protein
MTGCHALLEISLLWSNMACQFGAGLIGVFSKGGQAHRSSAVCAAGG